MNTIQFLLSTVISIYGFIFVLRAWFQIAKVDFYHPLSQVLVKVTQPVLNVLGKFAPTVKGVNLAALLACFILGVGKLAVIQFLDMAEASLVAYVIVGILNVVHAVGEAIFYVLLISAIMSWFNRSPNAMQYMLYQLSEPLLRPIRKLLPNTGMIDFSPMVVVFILFFANKVLYDVFGQLWAIAAL